MSRRAFGAQIEHAHVYPNSGPVLFHTPTDSDSCDSDQTQREQNNHVTLEHENEQSQKLKIILFAPEVLVAVGVRHVGQRVLGLEQQLGAPVDDEDRR